MHKTAVGYAIGKLLQVMGIVLLVPLGIAIYDNRHLELWNAVLIPEVIGFGLQSLCHYVPVLSLSYILGEGKNFRA